MGLQMEGGQPVIVHIDNLSFQYPSGRENSLNRVSFSIFQKESLLITGPTGCGKSTLLKAMSGIIPHASSGKMSGRVLIVGQNTRDCSLPSLSRDLGLVFQSPDDQLFCDLVEDEIAFGLENLGYNSKNIASRITDSLIQVGMEGFESAKTQELSGGQKQRVAIAAQLAMGAPILALDEPLSQLDSAGAREVLDCLENLRQQGLTIIIVEHRLSESLHISTRVIVMDSGAVVMDFKPDRIASYQDAMEQLGLEIPAGVRIGKALKMEQTGIPTVSAIADCVPCINRNPVCHKSIPNNPGTGGSPLLKVDDVVFSYPGCATPALNHVSLSVKDGETWAVMGKNGSGKSTLLGIISGLLKPQSGLATLRNRATGNGRRRSLSLGQGVGILFQNPDLLFTQDSVLDEISVGFLHGGFPKDKARSMALEFLKTFGLDDFSDMPPWSFSRGQRLQVALAAVLSPGPRVLLLDEPTTGQNKRNILNLSNFLCENKMLKSIIMCSHDLGAVCRHATHLALMDQGRIFAGGPLRELLSREDLLKQAEIVPHFALELSYATQTVPPLITTGEWMDVCSHKDI